jgi:hypothetical protein
VETNNNVRALAVYRRKTHMRSIDTPRGTVMLNVFELTTGINSLHGSAYYLPAGYVGPW